jgi:hypothetical protein
MINLWKPYNRRGPALAADSLCVSRISSGFLETDDRKAISQARESHEVWQNLRLPEGIGQTVIGQICNMLFDSSALLVQKKFLNND